MTTDLKSRLFNEILLARQRVYAVGKPTPLDHIKLENDVDLFLKREDLSPIHAYKWRGAYNRMAALSPEERSRGVVAASAGNHAQGVALAARALEIEARVYMPISAPRMKQVAVKRYGGENVQVELIGDDFDAANQAATADVDSTGAIYVHPYNDFGTMAGQGTLADEIVMSGQGPFDLAYIQIGGGGMAAAVSCWLKHYYPRIRIVGVEGVNQASMAAAIKAGAPTRLDYVDVFCDGTAVRQVGDNTFTLCRQLIDEFITVTNEEVCAAIQILWEERRCIAEPSGAMGLAGLLQQIDSARGKRVLAIVCGANLDFGQLAWVANHAGIGAARRRYVRFKIDERPGAMLELLEAAMTGVNIVEFQYGKVHETKAWPVIGFEASAISLDYLDQQLQKLGVEHEDVTSQEDVEFRIIHYEPALFHIPYFFTLEFPERAGALHDFLDLMRGLGNLCYFSYTYTGEQVGRALMGFEFDSGENRDRFRKALAGSTYAYHEIDQKALNRILTQ